MNRPLTLVALAIVAALPVRAVECPPPRDEQVLSVYLNAYADCLHSASDVVEIEVKEAINAKPAATSGFASGVRDSIEDFLPLVGFAVDSVSTSDDGKSAVLRLNPIRAWRWGSGGFTVTATEPEPGSAFLAAVPEGQRAQLKDMASQDLEDLSDVTFGAKWSFERDATLDDQWLLGRSYEKYEPFIENRLLHALSNDVLLSDQRQQIENRIEQCEELLDAAVSELQAMGLEVTAPVEPMVLPISAVKRVLDDQFDACIDAWRDHRATVLEADAKLDKLALLPFLIDNQPQIVLSAAWHERDPIVDRDGWEVKLSIEKGLENFNTILDEYHDTLRSNPALSNDDDALVDAFWSAVEDLDEQKVKAENKFTVSVTYGERKPYRLARSFGEGDDAIAVDIDLEQATDFCFTLEWHRNATWHPIQIGDSVVHPRFLLSGEMVDVSDDPMRQDRTVWTATYEVPLESGMTLPLSLTYANHSEFLGEPDEQLSAHFGISYKLPEKKKE